MPNLYQAMNACPSGDSGGIQRHFCRILLRRALLGISTLHDGGDHAHGELIQSFRRNTAVRKANKEKVHSPWIYRSIHAMIEGATTLHTGGPRSIHPM